MDLVTYALLNKKVKGLVSNIDHYDVDGLTLTAVCNDGTEIEIEFPIPVKSTELKVVEVPDPNDPNKTIEEVHLFTTLGDDSEYDSGLIPAGKSAYDIAVAAGFEGTEEEWLESLQGTSKTKVFQIGNPSSTWNLTHNFNNTNVTVTLYDMDGDIIYGADVEVINKNTVVVHFETEVAGTAIVKV